jgi:hypothetical protein
VFEDRRRRIFALVDKRCVSLLRGERAYVDECRHAIVGAGCRDDSAAIRMANEDDRAGGAGERRPYRGGVIGDSVKMVWVDMTWKPSANRRGMTLL